MNPAYITSVSYTHLVGDLHFNPDDVCFVERVYGLIGELQQAEKTYEARAQELEVDNLSLIHI